MHYPAYTVQPRTEVGQKSVGVVDCIVRQRRVLLGRVDQQSAVLGSFQMPCSYFKDMRRLGSTYTPGEGLAYSWLA